MCLYTYLHIYLEFSLLSLVQAVAFQLVATPNSHLFLRCSLKTQFSSSSLQSETGGPRAMTSSSRASVSLICKLRLMVPTLIASQGGTKHSREIKDSRVLSKLQIVLQTNRCSCCVLSPGIQELIHLFRPYLGGKGQNSEVLWEG